MPTPAEQAVAALETYHREVIAPAAFAAPIALTVGAFQTPEPAPYAEAIRARYKPVKTGWVWGPKWSTCWFRLTGTLKRAAKPPAGSAWHLRFNSDTEALLWVNGVPFQGLDVNRDLVALPASVVRGGQVALWVEAACNHPFGAVGLQWDAPETIRRWESETPGRLLAAELVAVNERLAQFARLFAFACGLARELLPASPPRYTPAQPWMPKPPEWQSARAEQLLTALRRAASVCRPGAVGASIDDAERLLRDALAQPAAGSVCVGHAVGHAHIDTAWLWPLRETRRKCLRTFSNVLRLMERDRDFTFLCSQAQQYAYVEADSPALFKQIAQRVAEGRWEPGGAMWIEPDANVPSGESLIRQILHADRYWRSRFGDTVRQRFLYLPDTFGFPAQLPQIMRHAGLDTFMTNKLSWHDTHPYPHTTFVWRGPDGSEVLAHQTPAHDYNAANTPRELVRAERNHRSKQLTPPPKRGQPAGPRFLHPFGFGDGGGGPTQAMTDAVNWARDCDGLPKLHHSRADDFCTAMHADVAAARSAGADIPVHAGPLDLELHRGTLTTQAWLKQANVEAEELLRRAELLLAGSPKPWSRGDVTRFRADLDRAWKLVLLNQFHDILPGSSITWVYDDARRDHEEVRRLVTPWIEAGLAAWSSVLDAAPGQAVVFNPASVESDGPSAAAPLSVSVVAGAPPSRPVECDADPRRRRAVLSNGRLEVTINALGEISSLRGGEDGNARRAEHAGGPLGRLVLYEDRPTLWDAWDIDRLHADSATPQLADATAWRVRPPGPDGSRASVEVERPLGANSRVTQIITLEADRRRVDVTLRIDWREERRLLRGEFPTAIHAEHALFQTQFGHVRRPTNPDPAAFELPVHRYAALSDGAVGLAVLNQAKFAAAVRERTLWLTLLRSPRYPDAQADVGTHEIRYALSPIGDARDLEATAERYLRPPIAIENTRSRGRGGRPAELAAAWTPLTLDAAGMVTISAFKLAEDDDGIIVRLVNLEPRSVECTIDWRLPVAKVTPADGLERPTTLRGFRHDVGARRTRLAFGPFQIVTLRAAR